MNEVKIGDIVGGFYDNGHVKGFIIGKVVDIRKSKILVSGASGRAVHSGDWFVNLDDIVFWLRI